MGKDANHGWRKKNYDKTICWLGTTKKKNNALLPFQGIKSADITLFVLTGLWNLRLIQVADGTGKNAFGG